MPDCVEVTLSSSEGCARCASRHGHMAFRKKSAEDLTFRVAWRLNKTLLTVSSTVLQFYSVRVEPHRAPQTSC
eukprot:3522830-Pyramimonas_sp.AAC.1